ncbi:bifunctional lysylphosphatidylglycerol flippase/synthetase MprF [Leifsonia soli]|uniref:Lysylphosphatidylglycerol synthetase-like protein (DUF2156 family) n=1 Tax=Leifsonia soli TaxID=582665 RepID=A0A852T5R9_9MICO|nr:DUF2156 domain-containing protein [Leifsonia soli]NYD75830.1 lysylphosphatidylglycerol synthetase-like protein (DUF2156 family) [Leifsonia soli]
MRHILVRILRAAARHPLALIVAGGAAGAGLAHLAWAGEVEFDGAVFSILSWLLLIAAIAVAERTFGSWRTAMIGSLATVVGVVVAWALLSAGAALGEPLSQEALRYQGWTPSVTSAALLVAVTGRLRPASRRSVRWAVGTAVVAILLISGHASDVARGIAALAGMAAGAVGRGALPGGSLRPSGRTQWRNVLASTLAVVACAVATASVTPNATGVLAWAGAAIDPGLAPATALLLVIGAALIVSGRSIGLLIGGGTLIAVAAVVATDLVIVPMISGELVWTGSAGADIEWQLLAIVSGAAPALAAVVLIIGARTVLRRPAAEPSGLDREHLVHVLGEHGDGAFAHMATWQGNSLWFGPDGSAVAYRVRDGVAFTVGDPIAERPAEIVHAFAGFCDERGWTAAFYSVHDETATALDRAGWVRTPVGTEAVVSTADFSLSGKRRQDLRTAVNRAGREGLSAVWTTYEDLTRETRAQVDALCAAWASEKRLPEMGFTLGGLPEMADPAVRLMLAVAPDGHVHAVTSWLPRRRGGRVVGWTLDVMRRSHAAMPGAIEFAIVCVIRRMAEEGIATVSLSGTPLAAHGGTTPGALSRRLMRWVEPAYGFASLERFKAKFGGSPEPLWMCYPQPIQAGRIARALVRVYVPDLRMRAVVGALRGSS